MGERKLGKPSSLLVTTSADYIRSFSINFCLFLVLHLQISGVRLPYTNARTHARMHTHTSSAHRAADGASHRRRDLQPVVYN